MGPLEVHGRVGYAAAGKFKLKGLSTQRWSGANGVCMQVIHSELDYRLTISEGISAFNVLQTRGVPSKFLVFTDENHVSFHLAAICAPFTPL